MSKKFVICFLSLSCALYAQSDSRVKIGAGLGAAFANTGVGAEYEMDQMAVLAGVGTFAGDGADWEIGGRYYFRSVDKKIRPHATVSYGAVEVMKYGFAPNLDHKVVIYGVSILAGLDHDFGKKDGFVMSYGLGLGIPGPVPQKVRDFYHTYGPSQTIPKSEIVPTLSLGIKYQFAM